MHHFAATSTRRMPHWAVRNHVLKDSIGQIPYGLALYIIPAFICPNGNISPSFTPHGAMNLNLKYACGHLVVGMCVSNIYE
jgi:hypothetical protein